MENKKKIKYDTMISVKVKKSQAEKLKKLADERDTSQGAIIRQWIEREVNPTIEESEFRFTAYKEGKN